MKRKSRLLRQLKILEVSGVRAGSGVGTIVKLIKSAPKEGKGMKKKLAKLMAKRGSLLAGADVQKAERKVQKQVDQALLAIQKAHPGMSQAGALLHLAQSREPGHSELWREYRALGDVGKAGGERWPWVPPNSNINPPGHWPLRTERLSPQPVVDVTGGPSLDSLVDQCHKANPALSRAQAYSRVMATPAGTAAYRAERDQRLAIGVTGHRQIAVVG